MTVVEARAIAKEYHEARDAMRAAMRRFEEARRAYICLTLSFEKDSTR